MRRWVWIVLIVLTVGLVSCAGLVGGGIWYASTQFTMREISQKDVEVEFAKMRTRFRDQKPLLDIRHDVGLATERLEARAQAYSGPPPKNLCLLVWTEEQPKAVQFCLPFWMLKMKSGKGLKFDVPNGESRRLELSAKDIERAGPALLLDEDTARNRLLVWTE
jgi:hypothetical protein